MSRRSKEARHAHFAALQTRDCTRGELDDAEHRASLGENVSSFIVAALVREVRRRRAEAAP